MIKDTGVGIKADNLEQLVISSKKEKNEEEGGSLGLTICREIAQILGKGLQFKSQSGHGTNFWFFIEAIQDKLEFNSTFKKRKKSSGAVIQKLSFENLESIQVSLNSDDEEICFKKDFKNFKDSFFEEKKNLCGADSQQTKKLHNFCLVKPKNHLNTNYSLVSDSSDTEDEEEAEVSQGETNTSHLSKNPSLIFHPEKPIKNSIRKSRRRYLSVKF
jgi:hypothetical protein